MRKISGVNCPFVRSAIQVIAKEELEHVSFGSFWYNEICKINQLDSGHDFKERLNKIKHLLPKRLEPLNVPLRKQCGFNPVEIESLQDLRSNWLDF